MKLSPITPKQQTILEILYRLRFVNRVQIQQLMHHKDYKRINAWLKDLREKQYVEWIYSDHFLEKTKPAVYYLGINGIRYLRQQIVTDEDGTEYDAYPLTELRKRYRESDRSEAFIARSVAVAGCVIVLEAAGTQTRQYRRLTQAVYADPDHRFHFLSEAEGINPSLCIIKRERPKGWGEKRSKSGEAADESNEVDLIYTNYLLEIFDPTTPRYSIRYRLKRYVDYISDDEWDSGENDPSPIILLVCSRLTDLIYAKRRLKKVMSDDWDEDDEDKPHIRFATLEQLNKHGITAKIWEEGRKVYGL